LIHSALVNLADRAKSASGAVQEDILLRDRPAQRSGLRSRQSCSLWRALRDALVDDRTESRKLEETRRDFVANVSHELKTPIGAIGLLAEAIAGATDDPEMVQKFAESLQKESMRLANWFRS
jgi:two-component system, OmpR family, sensor histidine kinase SenX3